MIVPLVSASGRPGNDRRDISASSSGNVNVSGVNYERPIVSALRRFYRESWGVPWPNASIFAEQSSFMIVYGLAFDPGENEEQRGQRSKRKFRGFRNLLGQMAIGF